MHLLQPVTHLLERFTEPFFQRHVEFFVDRLAHFVKLGGVFGLEILQSGFERAAHFPEAPLVCVGEGFHLRQQRLRKFVESARKLRALLLRSVGASHGNPLQEELVFDLLAYVFGERGDTCTRR